MIPNNTSVFISDLHLSPTHASWAQLLVPFLDDVAAKADSLYILGDLFDWWIGDDIEPEFQANLQQAFRRIKDKGTQLYFVAGNRDFLLSKQFLEKAGIQKLADPTVIDLFGTPTLLAHGDSLCTQDKAYQRYRWAVQSRFISWLTLQTPKSFRCRLAKGLRAKSQNHQKNLPADVLDVHPQAVIDLMNRYQVTQMIHGHVHRFAEHDVALANEQKGKRYVLGDWGKKATAIVVTSEGVMLAEYHPTSGLVPAALKTLRHSQ